VQRVQQVLPDRKVQQDYWQVVVPLETHRIGMVLNG
jgi:hypothetical protein